jgi:hypothetical protein
VTEVLVTFVSEPPPGETLHVTTTELVIANVLPCSRFGAELGERLTVIFCGLLGETDPPPPQPARKTPAGTAHKNNKTA